MTQPSSTTTTGTTTSTTEAPKGASGASGTETTTETWTPPATKEDYDKAISDAVTASKPVVPEKYEKLQLPKDSKLDPKIIERTAATARTLGLSEESAGKLLESIASEVPLHVEARVKEITDSFAPGGDGWKQTVSKWNEESLNHPLLGQGKADVLSQKKALAEKVAAKFGDKDFVELLKNDPMGSHPAVVLFLSKVGEAMGEGSFAKGVPTSETQKKTTAELMYGEKKTATA
jgi:hypothetical protein